MENLYDCSDLSFISVLSSQFDPTLEELPEKERKEYLKKNELQNGQIQKGQKTQKKVKEIRKILQEQLRLAQVSETESPI